MRPTARPAPSTIVALAATRKTSFVIMSATLPGRAVNEALVSTPLVVAQLVRLHVEQRRECRLDRSAEKGSQQVAHLRSAGVFTRHDRPVVVARAVLHDVEVALLHEHAQQRANASVRGSVAHSVADLGGRRVAPGVDDVQDFRLALGERRSYGSWHAPTIRR